MLEAQTGIEPMSTVFMTKRYVGGPAGIEPMYDKQKAAVLYDMCPRFCKPRLI